MGIRCEMICWSEFVRSEFAGSLLDLLLHLASGVVDAFLRIAQQLLGFVFNVLTFRPREARDRGLFRMLARVGLAELLRLSAFDEVLGSVSRALVGRDQPGRRINLIR